MQEPRPRWSARTKLTVLLLLLGLSIYLMYLFRAALAPFVIAVLLAFVLSPVVNWVESRLRGRRGLAALLTYLFLLVVLAVIPMVIIPPLAAQSADLNLNVRRFLSGVEALLGRRVVVAGFRIDLQQAIEQAAVSFQGLIEPLFSQTLLFAVEAISSLIWVVFIIVVSFYLVKDSSALFAWLARLTPSGYRQDFIRLRSEINLIWSAFLRGQLTLALVVALIFTGAGFAIGLPYALAMGVLAGLLEFLPSLGHGIWMIIAILLALFAGSTWLPIPNWAFALIIGGLHIFFQQFDLNYLIPRIIGRRVQLPPLVVILGIVTGALIAGVLGVVLAAPTIASARVLGRYIYANLLDWDPFPDAIAQPLPPPNPRWWKKADHEKGGITAKVEDGSHANRD